VAWAALVGADPAAVAVGHQVSPFVGLVAAALPAGAEVLVAAGEFTSVTFPFAARGDLVVREVPLEAVPEAIGPRTAAVAVSAVQSADGRVADLDALAAACAAHGTLSLVDVTQAAGWLPIGARRFDVVVGGTYKWLLSPRGTALCALSERARAELVPLHAGWYAGDAPWASIYGLPLRLAADGRRFDVSPGWLAWEATAPALELLAAAGVDRVGAHGTGLADALRAALGLAPTGSAIVSLDLGDDGAARLEAAGVRCATRGGRVRLSFHLHNTADDVDRVLAAIRPEPRSSSPGCSSSPAPAPMPTAPPRAS
jgi:selenocysteine lyase/cysteine desulfurase